MANKRMEFLIGIMVVTVFATIVIMTILFGAPKKLLPSGGSQKMTIVFNKAPGIGNNSRVMKSGVEIGRVFKSELIDETDKAEVRVYFNLNPGVKIYSNEYARINRTILGDAAIEFIKNPNYAGEIVERKKTDTITGVPGGDLMGTVTNIEGDLAKTIQSVNSAAKELTRFIGNLNTFLGSPEELERKKNRVETIFKELSDTLITTRNLASNMNSIVGDKNVQDNIRTAAANMPQIMDRIDALLGNANILADDFRETVAKTQQTFDKVGNNLDNLQDFTDALAEDGPEFIGSLNESGARMREMAGNINQLSAELSRQLNDPSTPLGMLGDPEVASSLRGTIKNAETITEKVQPVLDDARVFSNKIAHKPSSLIWGGRSYKGTPALSDGTYNFQPYTPNSGAISPLYTPTTGRNIMQCPLARSMDIGSESPLADPDSYAAYYAQNPEKAGEPMFPSLPKLPTLPGTPGLPDMQPNMPPQMQPNMPVVPEPTVPSATFSNRRTFSLSRLFGRRQADEFSEEMIAQEVSPEYGNYAYYGGYDGSAMEANGTVLADGMSYGDSPYGTYAAEEPRLEGGQNGVNGGQYLSPIEQAAASQAASQTAENAPAMIPFDAAPKSEPLPGPDAPNQRANFQPASAPKTPASIAAPSSVPSSVPLSAPAASPQSREESFVDDGLPLLYVPATEQ